MSQIIRKDVSEAVTRLPMADSNEARVVKLLVKSNGAVTLSGANWMHFGSRNLIKSGVLEVSDGSLKYGPLFEDYLISQAMAPEHLEYVRQTRVDGDEHIEMLSFLPEAFLAEFATASASRRMEMLARQVVSLMELLTNLSDAYERLEALVDANAVPVGDE